jgi:hypothetical protein
MATLQLHDSGANETVESGGQYVGRDTQAVLELGEPRHASEQRVPKDEQAPTLAHNLQGSCRRAVFVFVGSAEHAVTLLDSTCMTLANVIEFASVMQVATTSAHREEQSCRPAPGQDTTGVSASPAGVVNAYLEGFYSGDFEAARLNVADSFSFEGPFLQVEGKDAFFAGAEGLRSIVRGHRLLRQWVDGDDVSSLYQVDLETPAGKGSVLMSEWHRVTGGQLVSGRIVFDTAVFRRLVPAPPGSATVEGS